MIEHQDVQGAKALKFQAGDERYRAHDDYRAWHRTLGPRLFAWDLDLVEARQERDPATGRYVGPPVPVALTETTSVRTAAKVDSDAYLAKVFERLERSGQLAFLSRLAERASLPLFVIVHDQGLERFAIYEPKTGRLTRQTRDEHAAWIRTLGKGGE